MSTQLYLMTQPFNETDPDKTKWIFPKDADIQSNVITLLRILNVNPETEEGMVGSLYLYRLNREMQINVVTNFLLRASNASYDLIRRRSLCEYPIPHNRDIASVFELINLLSKALTLLTEIEYTEEGFIYKNHVAVNWS